MHGLRVIGIVHRQPVGNPEDRQRDQSLRGRRQVPQFAVLVLKLQRRRAAGAMLLQVGKGNGQATGRHPGSQTPGQRAAIKTVEAIIDQLLKRRGQRGLTKPATGDRRLSVDQKGLRKTWQVMEFGEFSGTGAGLGGGHRRTVRGIANRILQQARQRQRFSGQGLRDLERFIPAADGPGDGQRRLRPAVRNLRQPGVGLRRGQRTCRTAGVNGYRFALRRHDKPEAIAAQAVHMWVNHRNGGRRGDHGFYRAAAFAQHGNRALAGQMVRGDRHPVGGYITLHGLSS